MVADESVAVCEHERESNRVEQDAAKTSIHDALDEDVHRFAGAAETGLEHGESNLHSEDEKSRDQCPRGVHGIHDIRRFHFWSAGLCVHVGEEQTGDYSHHQQYQPQADSLTTREQASVTAPLRVPQPVVQAV